MGKKDDAKWLRNHGCNPEVLNPKMPAAELEHKLLIRSVLSRAIYYERVCFFPCRCSNCCFMNVLAAVEVQRYVVRKNAGSAVLTYSGVLTSAKGIEGTCPCFGFPSGVLTCKDAGFVAGWYGIVCHVLNMLFASWCLVTTCSCYCICGSSCALEKILSSWPREGDELQCLITSVQDNLHMESSGRIPNTK